jgi:phage shock protein PspC (stress-responsive transcriptional regulator)
MTTEIPTPQEPPAGPRRFERSRKRMIFGVAGGLGRYFNVDPVLIRIGFVALAIFGGTGFVVYGLAWLFVPMEGSSKPPLGIRVFRGDRAVWKHIGIVTAVIAGSALLAIGSAWATGLGHGTIVAGVVIAMGLALVFAAFRGGARWLILPALAIALPAGVVAAADVDLHGGVGDREYHPQTIQDVRDSYRLGAGRLDVDLRDVRFTPGDHHLKLRLGTGLIALIVPKDVCVATTAHMGAGYIGALDREKSGMDVDWSNEPTPPAGVPRLVVDAEVGLGALEIADRPLGHGHHHDQGFEPGLYGTNDACRGKPVTAR